ncbi:hypothetical protein ASD8599_03502 [Ascidiaceihabitans donghaensis]|uniref:DUF6630 domain-containing protein n=1 Tax=Ascidiaceihabitans donghaensis TaxID=1510460 RepID=A0A2R8BHZ9_9RHOB|nr:hypothetical protein [Ascidiaceihabitans donghaensis]SPH22754.1 hypothetical protein ASD8599_03502 [Ascidiaceihabitans donghaensis]
MFAFLQSLFSNDHGADCVALFYGELGGRNAVPPTAAAFVDVVLEEELLWNFDWRETSDDVVEALAFFFEQNGLRDLSKAEIGQITQDAGSKKGVELPLALNNADLVSQTRQWRLLSVDTTSDQYCVALVTPKFYARWVNVKICSGVCTQDHYRGGGKPPKNTGPRAIQ